MSILLERIVNLYDDSDKREYAQAVWDLLQQSYQFIGGFKSAVGIDELIEKTGLWKLVIRDGEITAVGLYRDQYGRKSIASGTNGSYQGKKDFRMIKKDDIKLKRAWAEVSGPVEIIMRKAGAKPIPSKLATLLTNHEILSYDNDGFHYTRLIGGKPVVKIMYGFVNLTKHDIIKFEHEGIDVQHLPDNLKRAE